MDFKKDEAEMRNAWMAEREGEARALEEAVLGRCSAAEEAGVTLREHMERRMGALEKEVEEKTGTFAATAEAVAALKSEVDETREAWAVRSRELETTVAEGLEGGRKEAAEWKEEVMGRVAAVESAAKKAKDELLDNIEQIEREVRELDALRFYGYFLEKCRSGCVSHDVLYPREAVFPRASSLPAPSCPVQPPPSHPRHNLTKLN